MVLLNFAIVFFHLTLRYGLGVSAIPSSIVTQDASHRVTRLAPNPGFDSSLSARARQSETAHMQIGNRIVSRDANLTTPNPITDDSMNCTSLSAVDAQKLKGFPQLQDWVKKNFGNGTANIVTNSPQYPNKIAKLCAAADPAPVIIQGNISCSQNTISSSGTMSGTSSRLALIFQQGDTTTSQWSVTNQMNTAVGASLTSKIDIPGLFQVKTKTTTSVSVKNAQTSQFTTRADSRVSFELFMTIPMNSQCTGMMNVTSCSAGAQATLNFVASGYILYFFTDPTSYRGGDDKHYEWIFQLESILPNEDDRTVSMTVNGNLYANSSSHYYGLCQ